MDNEERVDHRTCCSRIRPEQSFVPTVPELEMLILGAAVYITHISKENDRRAIRHLHGGAIVKWRHRRL